MSTDSRLRPGPCLLGSCQCGFRCALGDRELTRALLIMEGLRVEENSEA
jgi:hypothetical protein